MCAFRRIFDVFHRFSEAGQNQKSENNGSMVTCVDWVSFGSPRHAAAYPPSLLLMSSLTAVHSTHDTCDYDSDDPDHLPTRTEDKDEPDILVEPAQAGERTRTDNPPRLALQRTYEMKPLERSIPGDNLVATHRFYGSVAPASIDREELKRLEPGKWLTVNLVNFYLFEVANSFVEQNPGQGKAHSALPESIWSGSNSSRGKYSSRPRCDKTESALDFEFVAFPGNCTNSHFYLCIIAYASDILADHNPNGEVRTAGIILNSVKGIGPSDALDRFRNVILRLGKTRPIRKDGLKKLKVYYPEVGLLARKVLFIH